MKSPQTFAVIAVATVAAAVAPAAFAAPVFHNVSVPEIGIYDNAAAATGAAVQAVHVDIGVSVYSYIGQDGNPATLTVTRPDGADTIPNGYYEYSFLGTRVSSGFVYEINPFKSAADTVPGQNSGLRFTFSSPVSAFGFELGDWAGYGISGVTRPASIQAAYGVPAIGSGLWAEFDGGGATLFANALSASDNPGAAEHSYLHFVGFVDPAGFSQLDFWGDGFAESLYAGGTFRLAAAQGSVGGTVPEPASIALVGLAMAGLAFTRRRRASLATRKTTRLASGPTAPPACLAATTTQER